MFLASDGVAAERAASELDRSEGELTDVRARLEQALADADAARAERDRLAEELRDERLRARGLAADLRSTSESAAEIDSLLREEALGDAGRSCAWLGVAHARLHGPAERTRYPLRRVVVGPAFLDSLRELQGVSLHRVLDTCVHVATGRATEIPGLELHPLRAGAGGTEQRQRADGARAWRCALQVHSPVGAAPALLASRGRRRRARPRRHPRRRHLTVEPPDHSR